MGKSKNPSTACIIPSFLYLSPASTASSLKFLQTHQISTIISIGKTPSQKYPTIETAHGPESITYHRLGLEDKEDANLTKCVDAACAILEEARAARNRVLVHCSAAISRSPAVVAGYLVTCWGYTLDEALEVLRKVRPVVSPNRGFLEQLGVMEGEVRGRGGRVEVEREEGVEEEQAEQPSAD
ncbi:protein-tyrosine phosphatase-like protein [Aspergillus carlsbadensis]|nr:protein-tyrosine phosphatase-like protein [Aspergillus carlsbadensis]